MLGVAYAYLQHLLQITVGKGVSLLAWHRYNICITPMRTPGFRSFQWANSRPLSQVEEVPLSPARGGPAASSTARRRASCGPRGRRAARVGPPPRRTARRAHRLRVMLTHGGAVERQSVLRRPMLTARRSIALLEQRAWTAMLAPAGSATASAVAERGSAGVATCSVRVAAECSRLSRPARRCRRSIALHIGCAAARDMRGVPCERGCSLLVIETWAPY